MNAALSSLFSMLSNKSVENAERKRGIIALDEAVKGIEGDPYYDGMNW